MTSPYLSCASIRAEREPGDVRERLARADRQRCQNREDVPPEYLFELLELGGVQVLDFGDRDPLLLEGRLELTLPELRLLARQPQCAVADRAQRLLRGEAVRRADGDSRGRLIGQ